MIILFDLLSFKIPFKTLSRFGFQLLPILIKDVFDFCKINVRKNKINKKKRLRFLFLKMDISLVLWFNLYMAFSGLETKWKIWKYLIILRYNLCSIKTCLYCITLKYLSFVLLQIWMIITPAMSKHIHLVTQRLRKLGWKTLTPLKKLTSH